jgi:hypothetical protein
MDRRQFLTKAGLGTLAAASVPALVKTLALPDTASARWGTGFFFVAVSFAAPPEAIILNGAGRFTSRSVDGGGAFTHFRAQGEPPLPVVGTGTWVATELLGFTPTTPATYGVNAAGVLDLGVRLYPGGGSAIDATMTVVCNIGPGNLQTGHEEGVTLTIPGAPFGAFAPSDPPTGLTTFTND